MIVTREFSFDAAHHLPNYDGVCSKLHGHRMTCELSVIGDYDEKTGMVCDFSKLKQLIDNNVVSKLDHSCLNDILENPTAENIVVWIFDALAEDLERVGLEIFEIRLWETPKNSVTFKPYSEFDFELEEEDD